MKKIIPFIICIFLFISAQSQYYTFFTVGYNAGMSNSKNVVNTFVDDYNSRWSLTKKMNKQEFIQGFTSSWGLGSDNIFLDFMYTNKYSMHSASYIATNGEPQREDVRFTFNSVSIGLYLINLKHKSFRGPGLSFDIGKVRQKTRYGPSGTVEKVDYRDVGINSSLGVTLSYNYKIKIVKGVFLGLRPYYQLVKSDADIYALAYELNKKGFSGSSTAIKGGNYGLQINIAFGTYHYTY